MKTCQLYLRIDTFLVQTSFVAEFSFGRSRGVVSHGGVCLFCGSRLGRTAPLAASTFGSAAGKTSPLARPTPPSGCTSSHLARPNTGSVPGRVTPRPCGVSPGVGKSLARLLPDSSVESGSPLLRPADGASGCSPLPRPSQETPVILLWSGGLFGSI